jgi:hypothetical protein
VLGFVAAGTFQKQGCNIDASMKAGVVAGLRFALATMLDGIVREAAAATAAAAAAAGRGGGSGSAVREAGGGSGGVAEEGEGSNAGREEGEEAQGVGGAVPTPLASVLVWGLTHALSAIGLPACGLSKSVRNKSTVAFRDRVRVCVRACARVRVSLCQPRTHPLFCHAAPLNGSTPLPPHHPPALPFPPTRYFAPPMTWSSSSSLEPC